MRRLLLLLLLLIISCSEKNPVNQNDNTENEGTAIIEAVFSPQGAAKTAATESTVSATVFFYRSGSLVTSQPLQMSGRRATGSVDVKAGSGYTVRLEGYDNSGNLTYYGSTPNVTINAGKTTTVQLTLQKADEYQDIIFVSIPGGTFQMGDIQGGGNSEERPVHTVTVSGFEMSTYEITQGQYQSVMSSNPSHFKSGENYPVELVSWYDAVKFCNALSDAAGLDRCYDESSWVCNLSKNGFRLPAEAEWEYACRAGTETKYYTGNSENDLSEAGWYGSNSNSKTHPAGLKKPNAYGLYDMHGNVWEWCNDWYDEDYYSSSPQTNPTGPSSGSYRVRRSGSWSDSAWNCRSALRVGSGPSDRGDFLGFRVVYRSTPGSTTSVISGTINGAAGVTVTLSGDASDSQLVNTDGGTFSFAVINGGSYTVTPHKYGYTFEPVSQTFENVTSDHTDLFFNGSQNAEPPEITMVSIPGGSFRMGDIQGGGQGDERPVHTVTVSGFDMSKYEITQGEYESIIGSNPSKDHIVGADYPVYYVSWYDAVQFCNTLSEETGLTPCYNESTWECDFTKNGLRLPTEAEWEYACRAGTETKYYTGNSESDLGSAGWYEGNSSSNIHLVGQKTANAFGLFDMHGNVREWCNDWYDSGYYSASPPVNPTGPTSGSFRVFRGGSLCNAWECRSASRGKLNPSYTYFYSGMGFHVVRGSFTPTKIQHTLTMAVNQSGWGTTNPSVGTHTYYEGTVVTITETSALGYRFMNWTGSVANTSSATTTVTMSGDQLVTANFEKISVLTEIKMVSIPGGTFQMGDIQGVGFPGERPVHTVTVSGFDMSTYEITQGQYKSLIGPNPSDFSGSDDLPVENVSWYDAAKFCNRLSWQMGYEKCYTESGDWECDFSRNGFRLPTEAEWEYACRAGTETKYYTGNNENDLGEAGWYDSNSSSKTHVVGQKEPNAYGLYDLHGNVWEWCNDWYGSYTSGNAANPNGPSSGSHRVGRGGGWFYDAWLCRSAYRRYDVPTFTGNDVGFRMVRRSGQ